MRRSSLDIDLVSHTAGHAAIRYASDTTIVLIMAVTCSGRFHGVGTAVARMPINIITSAAPLNLTVSIIRLLALKE